MKKKRFQTNILFESKSYLQQNTIQCTKSQIDLPLHYIHYEYGFKFYQEKLLHLFVHPTFLPTQLGTSRKRLS